MIDTELFFHKLKESGVDFFTGVPDSLLSNLCACIEEKISNHNHIIAPNEGNAIALAAGYHLGTGKYAAVYMQNSGLGNAINPLTSLTDPQVYRIPMLLIIGWRGEPNVPDEPQHIKQGSITTSQLDLLGIPYEIIDEKSETTEILKNISEKLKINHSPVALLVRNKTFSKYTSHHKQERPHTLSREDSLRTLLDLTENSLIISTTGKTSREVYEIRKKQKTNQRDFLTVGSMGHASSIALGIALTNPNNRVVCLDGDGSMLMHMGALSMIGTQNPKNFVHVLINNAAHESVGGQRTVADQIDFSAISIACGYKNYEKVNTIDGIKSAWKKITTTQGPWMLEIEVNIKSRVDLGRPQTTPEENKNLFMKSLSQK